MRWEEKVPKGKLVCFSVETENNKVISVKITGDFFLHPEDAIVAVEQSLIDVPADIEEKEAAGIISRALGNAQLIGAAPEDFARIFKKAIQ